MALFRAGVGEMKADRVEGRRVGSGLREAQSDRGGRKHEVRASVARPVTYEVEPPGVEEDGGARPGAEDALHVQLAALLVEDRVSALVGTEHLLPENDVRLEAAQRLGGGPPNLRVTRSVSLQVPADEPQVCHQMPF
ncbi:hypothetical protein [Streptomyces sp. WZ.A104]|uniref:hypothetical protein n=1 Tax=Streptomyces sp. WZ.A104 TaxID=2023771 RepID=UPI00117D9BAA|nr:hypothetical protein [Streptomyces sp. WZ.A104]